MGHSDGPLKGPDLKNGIAVDSMKSGQKLSGHADGQPVLLIRENAEFYAIGAKCSHYGADLGEGLLSDGVIRCPWHHACFDIKTGNAAKAPALNPISTWETDVQNGVVYVRRPKGASSEAVLQSSGEDRFVIIGSGAAGHAAAESLRRLGFSGAITILTADSDFPYDRPNLSKDYLAGNAPEEWMPLRPPEFFAEKGIVIRRNTKVAKLDVKNKIVGLEGGENLPYTKCLIATGGSPVKPKITGIDLDHVHFLRSFSDCRALIGKLESAKRIVVVGAGFVGLEAAAALRARKLEVTIVAPGRLPLEHAVGAEVGAFLKSTHEENGVHFKLGRSVEKIERDAVVLSDKTTIPADLVLVAVGIKPSIELAQACDIKIENGILVDEYLETSAKDVFAAGDVARWPTPFAKDPVRIEHWVVAQRQGQAAAQNMMGLKKKYGDVPFFWSQQFDVVLSCVGNASSFTHVQVHGRLADRDCAVAYMENETVKAVLTIGRDRLSLEMEKAFENGDQAFLKRSLRGDGNF